jgi:hypothetical protein
MWSKKQTTILKGVTKASIWALWSNLDRWPQWDPDTEWAKIDGPFDIGSTITIKIHKGPTVKMKLVEVEKHKKYTDLTCFPLAKMYGCHEMKETQEGLELTTTMTIKGPFSFLWRKLVGEKIVEEIPVQFKQLEKYART